MSNGDPIVIKGGGSMEVRLSKDTFPPDSGDPDKHYNKDRKITRVEITDDATGRTIPLTIPDSGKFTIRIHHSL